MSDPRRILVVGSPFLRTLIREIARGAPDLEVVEESPEHTNLVDAAERTRADFAIVSVPDPTLTDELLDLFAHRPRMKVLALAGQGDDAVLWELRPHRTAYGQISPGTLLNAIAAPAWGGVGVG
ncbi:MAG: hypothetical protein JWN32_2850 [Solirubrobacterales bacterium]|nr:hypothetical protein [Solirubrobacterales bacterium]